MKITNTVTIQSHDDHQCLTVHDIIMISGRRPCCSTHNVSSGVRFQQERRASDDSGRHSFSNRLIIFSRFVAFDLIFVHRRGQDKVCLQGVPASCATRDLRVDDEQRQRSTTLETFPEMCRLLPEKVLGLKSPVPLRALPRDLAKHTDQSGGCKAGGQLSASRWRLPTGAASFATTCGLLTSSSKWRNGR